MRIAVGTVSCEGYGQTRPEAISNRLKVYGRVVEEASRLRADLVCFPGGYLRALDKKRRKKLAEHLVKKAKKHNIAIAVGIDVGTENCKKPKQQKLKKINSSNDFSAFAICWSPNEGNKCYYWKQRSSTSTDYKNEPKRIEQTYQEQRSLHIGSKNIEMLLCGELFNQIIRNNVISRSSDITAVVDLAHEAGRGFNRAILSMEILARGGLVTLCSIHANSQGTLKLRCNPPGERLSTRNPDRVIKDPTWVELKIWDV